MKIYYIDEVNVIVDGDQSEVVIVTGSGYGQKIVENKAIEIVRETYPNSKLVAQILSHKEVDLEEYERIIGSKPSWLI